MKKFILLLGAGLGFILGSRAGRGPYDQIEATVQKFRNRDDVQDAVDTAKGAMRHKAANARGAFEEAVDNVGQELDDLTAALADVGTEPSKRAETEAS